MCPPNAIDTLLVQPVLLDDLAALDDDWGDVDVVPHHLIGKVQAERRPPVGEVCVRGSASCLRDAPGWAAATGRGSGMNT